MIIVLLIIGKTTVPSITLFYKSTKKPLAIRSPKTGGSIQINWTNNVPDIPLDPSKHKVLTWFWRFYNLKILKNETQLKQIRLRRFSARFNKYNIGAMCRHDKRCIVSHAGFWSTFQLLLTYTQNKQVFTRSTKKSHDGLSSGWKTEFLICLRKLHSVPVSKVLVFIISLIQLKLNLTIYVKHKNNGLEMSICF